MAVRGGAAGVDHAGEAALGERGGAAGDGVGFVVVVGHVQRAVRVRDRGQPVQGIVAVGRRDAARVGLAAAVAGGVVGVGGDAGHACRARVIHMAERVDTDAGETPHAALACAMCVGKAGVHCARRDFVTLYGAVHDYGRDSRWVGHFDEDRSIGKVLCFL